MAMSYEEGRTNGLARIVALAGAACLLAAALGMVFFAYITSTDAISAVSEKKALVSRMEALLRQRQAAALGGASQNNARTLLQGNTASLAAANLQQHMVSSLGLLGVSPISIEVSFPQNTYEIPVEIQRVQARFELVFKERELPGILRIVENGYPVLIVDELQFSTRAARRTNSTATREDEWEPLAGHLVVSGFWSERDFSDSGQTGVANE